MSGAQRPVPQGRTGQASPFLIDVAMAESRGEKPSLALNSRHELCFRNLKGIVGASKKNLGLS